MSIGIVVQGLLNGVDDKFLNSIIEYKKYGPVILSSYNNVRLNNDFGITEIYSPLRRVNWYNVNNLYYQAFSSFRGLSLLDTEFVIKVRTNESYSDISKFVDKVINNPNKVITNNVAFTKTEVQPLHPSDHMIGGKLSVLLNSFKETISLCKSLPNLSSNIFGGELGYGWMGNLLAEQILCLFFLKNLGFEINTLKQRHDIAYLKEIMRQYFDLVPVEDLGEVVHSISYNGGRNYRKNGEGLYGYAHESIRNISEV